MVLALEIGAVFYGNVQRNLRCLLANVRASDRRQILARTGAACFGCKLQVVDYLLDVDFVLYVLFLLLPNTSDHSSGKRRGYSTGSLEAGRFKTIYFSVSNVRIANF